MSNDPPSIQTAHFGLFLMSNDPPSIQTAHFGHISSKL